MSQTEIIEALTTADGEPLQKALARATRHARFRAFFLVVPLLLFVIVTFAVPIAQMLYLSIHNP
ncbi:MAG: ABC transporter permease, partial [Alphaproteobacteria bacterium]